MPKQKGPTFNERVQFPEQIEKRYFEVHDSGLEHRSSNVIYLFCPFCDREIKAYLWSLHGSGKRCECGAIFNSLGMAQHWRNRNV